MTDPTGSPTHSPTFVVTGGTANMGALVAAELLARGATVAVPSRSASRLDELRAYLTGNGTDVARLVTVTGDLGDAADAPRVRDEIVARAGEPAGVLASFGSFVTAERVLDASQEDLRTVLDGYVVAHFTAARTFLPGLRATGGTYLMLQGPIAFDPAPGTGTELISIATAAQQMLFRTVAAALEGTPARVVELVSYAFVRDRRTQPGSALTGEDVARRAADLLAGGGGAGHGESVHLRTADRREVT